MSLREYNIAVPDGNVKFSVFGADIVECLCNGAGWPLLVRINHELARDQWHAVGHYQDKAAVVPLPTILIPVVDGVKQCSV
jgi:hypothetical protein